MFMFLNKMKCLFTAIKTQTFWNWILLTEKLKQTKTENLCYQFLLVLNLILLLRIQFFLENKKRAYTTNFLTSSALSHHLPLVGSGWVITKMCWCACICRDAIQPAGYPGWQQILQPGCYLLLSQMVRLISNLHDGHSCLLCNKGVKLSTLVQKLYKDCSFWKFIYCEFVLTSFCLVPSNKGAVLQKYQNITLDVIF